MKETKDGHITTRIDPELKETGRTFAAQAERTPAWVFAKAIEFGLPEVIKRYSPSRARKSSKAEQVTV